VQTPFTALRPIFPPFHTANQFNPAFAVAIYCGLKILAATLVSRFCSSTYLWICLRCKIAPTARFAAVLCASLRQLLQNLGKKSEILKQ
jgi:hypothetical protein